MRAEVEPVKIRRTCLFQTALHLGIDGANLLLGDQASGDHPLVADYDQLKVGLFQASEGLWNAL